MVEAQAEIHPASQGVKLPLRISWKDADPQQKVDVERLGRRGTGWYRLRPEDFPGIVGGYRDAAASIMAVVEGTTVEMETRSDCTVVTFVGNRLERDAGEVDQEVWVTAVHSTGMSTKVAEFQHPDYEGRTRTPTTDFWSDAEANLSSLNSLTGDRDSGPLADLAGTVYEEALKRVRDAASATTEW